MESTSEELCLSAKRAPKMIMPEMALETLINGECKAGVTPQTTKYPTKQASIKIVKSAQISMVLSFHDAGFFENGIRHIDRDFVCCIGGEKLDKVEQIICE